MIMSPGEMTGVQVTFGASNPSPGLWSGMSRPS